MKKVFLTAALFAAFTVSAQTGNQKSTQANVNEKEQQPTQNPNNDAKLTPEEQKSNSNVSGNAKKPDLAPKTSSQRSTDGTTRPDGTGTGTPIRDDKKKK